MIPKNEKAKGKLKKIKMEKTVYYLTKNYFSPQLTVNTQSPSFAVLNFNSAKIQNRNLDEPPLKKKNSLFGSFFKPKKAISSAPTSPNNNRSLVENSNRLSFVGNKLNQPTLRKNSNIFKERKSKSFEKSRKNFKNVLDLLDDPIGREYFRIFSEMESSLENLNFWEDVEKFKNMDDSERRDETKRIFQLYLTPISEQEIGIPSRLCKNHLFIR
jgi:hypothetical protein